MEIISINPKTEEIICKYEVTSNSEIDLAITKSKSAQKKWKKQSKDDVIRIMNNVKENLIANKNLFVEIINEECGFNKEDIEDEFDEAIDGFNYYESILKKQKAIDFPIDIEVFPESTSQIKLYPLGVILQIGIWNFPFWQTMITAIPALLTGNSIIYKPSEHSTKTGLFISKIINESKDFPEDLFIPIIGSKKQGKYLVDSEIDAIVYTGNRETGLEILKNSNARPTILELSGNDPAIICGDCDMEQTVSGISAGTFLHSGEVCDRIKRIYVVKSVAEEFVDKFVAKVSTYKIGEDITPLISKEAQSNVHEQVETSFKDGAKLLLGGKIPDTKGYYYEATILEAKGNNVYSMQNEIFGPVVTIMVVENEEEALKLANDSIYGLGASVWTQDYEKANEIADEFESGMVWVNDSNIPLVCGEYFKGWKSTSIPNASDRLNMFQKSKTIISFNSNKKRDWWF